MIDDLPTWPIVRVVSLSPATRWGQLTLTIVDSVGSGTDPYDFVSDRWSMPLWHGYAVMRLNETGEQRLEIRRPWRWWPVKAEEPELLLGRAPRGKRDGWPFDRGRFCTLVWERPPRRIWGFWQSDHGHHMRRQRPRRGNRAWVPFTLHMGLPALLWPAGWSYEKPDSEGKVKAWHPELIDERTVLLTPWDLCADERERRLRASAAAELNRRTRA